MYGAHLAEHFGVERKEQARLFRISACWAEDRMPNLDQSCVGRMGMYMRFTLESMRNHAYNWKIRKAVRQAKNAGSELDYEGITEKTSAVLWPWFRGRAAKL